MRLRLAVERHATELVALLVVTIWGVNFVFIKAALDEWDPLAFTFVRYVGMLALSWGVLLWQRRQRGAALAVARADLGRVALAGLLGFSCYMLLSIIGLDYTTAFSNALLLAVAPLFVALLLRGLGAEQVSGRQWLALLVSFAGVVVFLSDKAADGLGSASAGDLISLAAAGFFAAYTVANRPLLARYPAPRVTAWTLAIGSVPVLLVTAPAFGAQDWSRFTALGWLLAAWAAIVPVYIAWTLWSWVNHRDGVGRASVFIFLTPIVGGVTSWLLLDEGFGALKIGGALLTLAGLVLARRAARAATRTPASEIARPPLSAVAGDG
jgi:drug/metabolite transporter (DMT)-like permease